MIRSRVGSDRSTLAHPAAYGGALRMASRRKGGRGAIRLVGQIASPFIAGRYGTKCTVMVAMHPSMNRLWCCADRRPGLNRI